MNILQGFCIFCKTNDYVLSNADKVRYIDLLEKFAYPLLRVSINKCASLLKSENTFSICTSCASIISWNKEVSRKQFYKKILKKICCSLCGTEKVSLINISSKYQLDVVLNRKRKFPMKILCLKCFTSAQKLLNISKSVQILATKHDHSQKTMKTSSRTRGSKRKIDASNTTTSKRKKNYSVEKSNILDQLQHLTTVSAEPLYKNVNIKLNIIRDVKLISSIPYIILDRIQQTKLIEKKLVPDSICTSIPTGRILRSRALLKPTLLTKSQPKKKTPKPKAKKAIKKPRAKKNDKSISCSSCDQKFNVKLELTLHEFEHNNKNNAKVQLECMELKTVKKKICESEIKDCDDVENIVNNENNLVTLKDNDNVLKKSESITDDQVLQSEQNKNSSKIEDTEIEIEMAVEKEIMEDYFIVNNELNKAEVQSLFSAHEKNAVIDNNKIEIEINELDNVEPIQNTNNGKENCEEILIKPENVNGQELDQEANKNESNFSMSQITTAVPLIDDNENSTNTNETKDDDDDRTVSEKVPADNGKDIDTLNVLMNPETDPLNSVENLLHNLNA